jgi:hypothetical protein
MPDSTAAALPLPDLAEPPAPCAACALLYGAPASSAPPHRTQHTSWLVLDPSTTIFITVASFPMMKTMPPKPMAMATLTRS